MLLQSLVYTLIFSVPIRSAESGGGFPLRRPTLLLYGSELLQAWRNRCKYMYTDIFLILPVPLSPYGMQLQ
jgi:hypothetical protein